MEFPRAFNGEPLQAFKQSAARTTEARSVAGAGLAPHTSWRERQPIPEECDMPAKKLSEAEIKTLLSKAKGWSLVNGKLHREFTCDNFVTAFGNMTRVALVSEAMNHPPEWFNVWNKVVIDLNTHSVKGISDFDFVLAEKINEIFEPFPPLRLPGSGKGQ
jgi:4a-hydroxytetrahydrobiopterin dehydratase